MSENSLFELDRLIVAEAVKLKQNRLCLGEQNIQQLALIESAYDFLLKSFAGLEVNEIQTVLLQFIAGSKMQVATGFLSLLRGQQADSQSNLRKAIEQLLFAVNLFERPLAAEKWLYISRSQQSYKEYRREFNIMDMLNINTYETLDATDHKIVECLIERYEMCCLSVHATPWAQGKKLSTISPEGKLGLWMLLVDPDDSTLLDNFWFDADTHAQILLMFGRTVEFALASFNKGTWYALIDNLIKNHSELVERYTPAIEKSIPVSETRAFWQVEKDSRRRKTGAKEKSQSKPTAES